MEKKSNDAIKTWNWKNRRQPSRPKCLRDGSTYSCCNCYTSRSDVFIMLHVSVFITENNIQRYTKILTVLLSQWSACFITSNMCCFRRVKMIIHYISHLKLLTIVEYRIFLNLCALSYNQKVCSFLVLFTKSCKISL